MKRLKSLAIIGGGSWATALVKVFSESGIQIHWFLRSDTSVEFVKEHGRNPNYLSYLHLKKDRILPSSRLEDVVQASDHVLIAVPSAYLESTFADLDAEALSQKDIIVSVKGILPGTNALPTEYLRSHFNVSPDHLAVLGGPCHAEEIAMERDTYMTFASQSASLRERIIQSLDVHYIRAISNDDPMGVEVTAIMKNIVSVACGIARGLNFGDNFQAVLVSNAMHEVERFLHAMDPMNRNLYQSGYFGDLLVTAYSEYSRNRNFGLMIGRGYSVMLARDEMSMVAEGYYATKGIYEMARTLQLELPVVSAVYRILYGHIAPYVEFKLLETLIT